MLETTAIKGLILAKSLCNTQKLSNQEAHLSPAFPIMAVVFIAYLVIGMALPSLPLYVHDDLKYGPTVVGIVAGGQFASALVTRFWAGMIADKKGAKYSVLLGLVLAFIGVVFYLASCASLSFKLLSVTFLFVGRIFLGGAESLIITGGMLWGLNLVSPNVSGKVMSWIGMSMFASLAIGAPIGSFIYNQFNFTGVSTTSIFLILASVLVVIKQKNVTALSSKERKHSESYKKILSSVALPGIIFALSGITFGAITSFLVLYFTLSGWQHGAYAFALFAASLIVTRIIFGHLPDQLGGRTVTIYSLIIQITGLVILASAQNEPWAMLGTILSGIGFSLIFPSLGNVVVKTVSETNRGIAIGTYNAFLDLTLGLGSPMLGGFANLYGMSSVFTISAVASAIAIPATLVLRAPAD
jgi:MFS family permease